MATYHEINHDSGLPITSHWDSVTDSGSFLDITVNAALNGSANGLEVVADFDAVNTWLLVSNFMSPVTNELVFRIMFDPNSFDVGSVGPFGNGVWGLEIVSFDDTGEILARISFDVFPDDNYQINVGFFKTSIDFPESGHIILTDEPHCIELVIVRESSDSAADGTAALRIDGTEVFSVGSLENFEVWTAINQIRLSGANGNTGSTGFYYIDEILVDDDASATLCGGAPALWHLGMASDSEYLYLTSWEGGTLVLRWYALTTFLEAGSDNHGAGTQLAAQSRDIFIEPVCLADGVVYLYGHDGSNIKAKKNEDLHGVGSWVDIGDGGWAGVKICKGAFINLLDPSDIIAIFDDDDVYRSQNDGTTWDKESDAPSGILRGVRHPIDGRKIMIDNLAAGTLNYSRNNGDTWEDVSDGTTITGEIEDFEVSL